jgi:hypothetical protein
MAIIGLPISDKIVDFDIPPESRVAVIRHLIANNGRDLRLNRFVVKPDAYGRGVVAKLLHAISEDREAATTAMEGKRATWLRYAAHTSKPTELSGDLLLGYLLTGVDPVTGEPAPASEEQVRTMRRAARVTLGHPPCEPLGACRTCLALRHKRWGDALELEQVDPELIRELYRGFVRAGFPSVAPSIASADF